MATAVQIPIFRDRIREHTAPSVNDRIDQKTRASIDKYIGAGREAILGRLGEIDREWDIDRVVMLNFSVLGGATFGIGLKRFAMGRLFCPRPVGFLYLFGAQLGFLLLHAAVGWCPPVALFRRLGYRSKAEIETERRELLAALNQ